MTKIIICDDNEHLANQLADQVNITLQNIKDDNQKYEQLDTEIEVFTDSLRLIGYTEVVDVSRAIFFLDIELNQSQNGVDIAEKIRKNNPDAQIIFVTAYDKYAPLTYRKRIGAIDYINKADSDNILQRLNETLLNAFKNLEIAKKNEGKYFIYQARRRTQRLPQADVIYVMNSNIQHKVVMVHKHGEAEFRGNVSKIEAENPFLVKVSQSYLINPENIKEINIFKKTIMVSNEETINYTRTYSKVVKSLKKKLEK